MEVCLNMINGKICCTISAPGYSGYQRMVMGYRIEWNNFGGGMIWYDSLRSINNLSVI